LLSGKSPTQIKDSWLLAEAQVMGLAKFEEKTFRGKHDPERPVSVRCGPFVYAPSRKTMGVSPQMNAQGRCTEARRAEAGASADSAKEMKDTMGVNSSTLHLQRPAPEITPLISYRCGRRFF
jgi:hypothetical protein